MTMAQWFVVLSSLASRRHHATILFAASQTLSFQFMHLQSSHPKSKSRRNFKNGLPNKQHPLPRLLSQRYATSNNVHGNSEEPGLRFTSALVQDVMNQSIQFLEMSQVDEARESVFHLLSHVLGLSWERGFLELRDAHAMSSSSKDSDSLLCREMTEEELQQWKDFLGRRLNHEPIQYILGKWDFLDYTLKVQAPLLCPRPETEELVLLVSQKIQSLLSHNKNHLSESDPVRVLDVGCGTGCIGVSLASMHPQLEVTAIDIDPVAVHISTENAQEILGKTESMKRYHALEVAAEDFATEKKFDLVVSNPPYILPKEMADLDATVQKFENHLALSGLDEDGLKIIRQIVFNLPNWCKPDASCFMEVHPTHPPILEAWLSGKGKAGHSKLPPTGVQYIETVQDFQRKDRFVHLQWKTSEVQEELQKQFVVQKN